MKWQQHPRKKRASSLDEPTLNISSLIDVCFLLLIYFLVTTSIQPREQDLSTYVPASAPENFISIPPMVIEIRQGGVVVVNPGDAAEVYDADISSRQLPELRGRLQMLSGLLPSNGPAVILKVHDEARQQRYIDVVNCLAGAGIRSVVLVD